MTVLTRRGILQAFEKLQCPDVVDFLQYVYADAASYPRISIQTMIGRPDSPRDLLLGDLRLIEMLTAEINGRTTVIRSLEYFETLLEAIPLSSRAEINRNAGLERKRLSA